MRSAHVMDQDFSKLFGALPGFFMVIDRNATIIATNDNFRAFLKDSCPSPEGLSITTVFPFITPGVEKVLREQKEHQDVFVEAAARIIKINFNPVVDEGEVSSIILQIHYQSRQSFHTAQESGQLFEDLFEFNPAALTISGVKDSRIRNVNAAFLQLFEFEDKNQVVGKTARELNLLPQSEQRNDIVRLLMEKQKVVFGEGQIRTQHGSFKWASISVILVNVEGEPCLMAVMIDITDRKNAEDKIKSINTNLEKTVIQKTKQALEAELEYRSVIEQANDGIFVADEKGNYVNVNASACQMLGYTKEELLHMHMKDLLSPEDRVSNPPRFSELMMGKPMLTMRSLQKKDGTLIPVEISARMLSNGKMLGIVRDITDRKRAEEAAQNLNTQLEEMVRHRTQELERKIVQLHESEEKFQKAFHASSAGITMTRLSDSTYVDVNDAFLNLIGYKREEVINHTALDLSLVADVKHRERVLEEVRTKGAVRQMEMTVRKKSGEFINILSSIETIMHNGERYAINIIYDITERKRAQEKLEAVNNELESFSYSVSHDLRAPLRSILGYAEILHQDFGDQFDETMAGHLKRITNSARKMGRLIDDLLEFSRLGKLEIVKTRIDTEKIVEKIIADLALTDPNKPKFIVNQLDASHADFAMINQVWFNLISNAVKYSSKKEAPAIEIGSYTVNHETIFFVKDNGAGFNMDFAGKLFGVFQRLHRAADFEGTGVGLALVKRIIDKHDGRIWATAAEQKGATFYFALPIRRL